MREAHTTIARKKPRVLFLWLVVFPYNRAGKTYQGKARDKRTTPCKVIGGVKDEAYRAQEMTTKKRVSETQTVTLDADELPFGLHLKHVDIPPPLTFICRRCGTERLWSEPHGFDCQVAMAEQQRKQVMGDDAEAGKK